MAGIEWGVQYILGIKEMDEQHQALVEKAKTVLKQTEIGEKQAGEIVSGLKDLIRNTKDHFQAEETLMGAYAYPELDNHKKMHRLLLDKINQFQARIDENKAQITKEAVLFIESWLTAHIIGMDKSYAAWIKVKGLS